jgi:CRP-like cAMP-binding protein
MQLARLEAIPMLAELPFGDRAAVATVACETHADAGDVLVREGAFLYELIAIESGEAGLYHDGEFVTTLRAGDVVGEIGCFERRVGTVTLVACSAMGLVTLSARDMRRLRRSAPAAVARMQALLLRLRGRRVAG